MTPPISILIVDDDPVSSMVLDAALKKMGFQVLAIEPSGEEALLFLERNQPDLILLDIVLKGELDGIEVGTLVRKLYTIPVIFMTGHDSRDTFERARISDPFAYLIKPVRMRELALCIEIAIQRKAADQARAERERNQSLILNSLQEGVLFFDGNSVLNYLNSLAASLLGIRPADAIGKTFDDLFILDGLKENQFFSNLSATGVPAEGKESILIVRKNEILLSISFRATPLISLSGAFNGVVFAFTKLSLNLDPVEAIRQNLVVYKSVLNGVSDGVIIYSVTEEPMIVNRAFKEVFLPPLSGVFDQSFDSLVSLCLQVSDGKLDRVKLWARDQKAKIPPLKNRPDGRDILIRTTPIKNQFGESMALMAVFNDNRLLHLEESERIQSDKLKALGLLAGGIAHDFNNALAASSGILSALRLGFSGSEPELNQLKKAELILNHAGSLASRLLVFSEGGVPVKKRCNIRDLIERSLASLAGKKRVTFTFLTDGQIPEIEADPRLLEQVFYNLAKNSAESLTDRVVNLWITLSTDPPSGAGSDLAQLADSRMVISFRDDGSGIPEQNLPFIFDPFFTTRKQDGMGLAVAYSILQKHGGDLSVHSEEGKGSVFTIRLPGLLPHLKKSPENRVYPADFSMKPVRILILEDEEFLQEVFEMVFRKLNYDPVIAGTGEKVLQLYQNSLAENPFDLVILDLVVKNGMGGKETISELIKLNPGVKAIVTSGYSSDPVLSDFRRYGFSDALVKPFELEEADMKIKSLIRQS
ncbi:MAG: response regulator [Bacteroidetes bacterium]|nr:response regulator [Bacteroidota bacterium]